MEGMVKKYQQKFRKVRDETRRWDEVQSRLLSQFRNASSIIERLPALQNSKNYGVLKCIDGIENAVLRKQMESLETLLLSLKQTLKEFHDIVLYLEKIVRDGRQLVKGGSVKLTTEQLQQRIGVKPTLMDCLDGLSILHDMHQSEYLLKSSVVSALPTVIIKPSTSDLGALHQLLVDQPNIPKEEGTSLPCPHVGAQRKMELLGFRGAMISVGLFPAAGRDALFIIEIHCLTFGCTQFLGYIIVSAVCKLHEYAKRKFQ